MNPRVSARDIAGAQARPDFRKIATSPPSSSTTIACSPLFGEHDEHLALIEHQLGVDITPRGNRISVKGPQAAARQSAQAVLTIAL